MTAALYVRASVAVLSCGLLAFPASAGSNSSEKSELKPTILQIRVLEGESAVHTAGARAIRPLTLQITDETGKPVEGATVSFRLPEQGASGHFGNGLRSELVTSTDEGRAIAWGIQWDKAAGPVEIRITAAKGEARAGTITSLYLREAPAAGQLTQKVQIENSREERTVSRPNWKWIALSALVAGAAAGGIAALTGASKAPTFQQPFPSASPTAQQPAFSLGAPVLSVGKP